MIAMPGEKREPVWPVSVKDDVNEMFFRQVPTKKRWVLLDYVTGEAWFRV